MNIQNRMMYKEYNYLYPDHNSFTRAKSIENVFNIISKCLI